MSTILWRNAQSGNWNNGSGGFTGKDLGIVSNSYQVQSV